MKFFLGLCLLWLAITCGISLAIFGVYSLGVQYGFKQGAQYEREAREATDASLVSVDDDVAADGPVDIEVVGGPSFGITVAPLPRDVIYSITREDFQALLRRVDALELAEVERRVGYGPCLVASPTGELFTYSVELLDIDGPAGATETLIPLLDEPAGTKK